MNDVAITYKTNKLTVNQAYRNLVLPLNEICELKWKWIIFPVATFHMVNGRKYTFIIYNKGRFVKCHLLRPCFRGDDGRIHRVVQLL